MVRKLVRRLLSRYLISEPAQFKSINKIKRSSVDSHSRSEIKKCSGKTVNQKFAYKIVKEQIAKKNFEIMASNIIQEQLKIH